MDRNNAARHEGKFTVTRMMTGEKVWKAGDKREGKVADLAHLAETGAIVPRDEKTAEALTAFFGREFEVGKAPPTGAIANADQDADGKGGEVVLDEAGKAAAAELEKDNTKKELVALAEKESVEFDKDDNKGPLAAKIVAARQAKAAADAGSNTSEGGGQNKAEANDAKTK